MTVNTTVFHDPITPVDTTGLDDRFFDRFMFNLHPADSCAPSIIMGFGHYPARNIADGYAIISLSQEQRNLRFSTELNLTEGNGAGPLRFECLEPNQRWRLQLGSNPTGMEYDIVWEARTPYWLDVVEVENKTDDTPTNFEHLVQSGRYRGVLKIDGVSHSVDGWYGQRDRSRGMRTMSGGQGLHIWFQPQFPDRSISLLLVEGRDGSLIMAEGAVLKEDGDVDYIAGARHALRFEGLDLAGGVVEVTTKSGDTYTIEADASGNGGYMAGAGYGGSHGKARGRDYQEFDVYPFDGTVSQRTLDTSLTDRLSRFSWNGQVGYGIFEFALSRSAKYQYKPTLV